MGGENFSRSRFKLGFKLGPIFFRKNMRVEKYLSCTSIKEGYNLNRFIIFRRIYLGKYLRKRVDTVAINRRM